MGKEFGLEGNELLAFVREQQEQEKRRLDEEREERQQERESKKREAEERERLRLAELETMEKEAERRHQLALKQLEIQGRSDEESWILAKGCWQIPVSKEDILKTAFVTPDGSCEFVRMPFGMMNSGATLVRGIRRLLENLDEAESYIDDIIVFTETWEQHLVVLNEVLGRLSHAGFTARPTKCVLGANSIEVVGHRISDGVKGLHEDNVRKIRDAKRPTTKKEVKAFLGLTGYYRGFIPNYAAKAAPLSDLTKKGLPNLVKWSEAQEKAYTTLKAELIREPILRLPDNAKPFTLRTDASEKGIGAVLLQEHEGKLTPVSYASRKLSDRERKYSTIERECLAIVWAVRKFLVFVHGVEFTLQTDHQPLLYMNTAKFLND